MSDYIFTARPEHIPDSECFHEASKDELKVLLAVIAVGARRTSYANLADIAGVSEARTKAALTLFEESGIIEKVESSNELGDVIYEFENKIKPGERVAESAHEAARTIRENNLYELQRECEKLLGKSLSSYEIGILTSLYNNTGLSPQYILLLASFLTETKKEVKMSTIARNAETLQSNGIDTLEDLERYIIEKSKEIKGEAEMRRLLGIKNRSLTKTERKYFDRWLNELCFSSVIIGEAYDICVASTAGLSLSFMDKVLTAWHENGCKTLDECIAQHEQHRETSKQKNTNTRKSPKKEAEVPKYAEFDSEDALMRALMRSYGDSEDKT